MEALSKLTKELLPSKKISEREKDNFFSKLKIFNRKEKVNFYVDFAQHGESDDFSWVLIRRGGPERDIVKERRFRNKMTQSQLQKTIDRLKAKTSVRYKLAI